VELMACVTADAGGSAGLRRAAMLLGAADRIWRDFGLTKLRDAPLHWDPHRRCEATVRAGLGDPAFQAAFTHGAEMQTADACAAIIGTDAGKPPATGPGDAQPLTRLTAREQEVADLIAGGLTNREIAAKLVVSTRTAESHVQNILIKLGFTSRAQIAPHLAAARRPDHERDGPGTS
jgi:non-specific serine/threonine protein kinase